MQQPSTTSSRSRVLIVEDDRASRGAMLALLRLAGYEALPAGTVAEGLGMLERHPQCLILDLMLPDGNGSSILAHVRRNKLPICVAVTTGAMDWKVMLEASETPPDAVFTKPVNFQLLTDWLKEHCQCPRAQG